MSQTVYAHGGDWVPAGISYKVYRELGYKFAMRYVVPSIPGKLISLPEVASAHANGVDMVFIYETSGATWQGGKQAGLVDGEIAHNMLKELGAPYSVACYHAVDTQVSSGQLARMGDWLDGVITGMAQYATGVYGEFAVVEFAARAHPDVYRWQTKAWSGGSISELAHLLQLGATDIGQFQIDIDVAYAPHFGQWYADPNQQPDNLNGDGMIQGFIPPVETIGVPFRMGTYTTLVLYCDTGLFHNEPQEVRIAIHSNGKGYSQIQTIKLQAATPVTVTFEQHDVNAISFSRNAGSGYAEIGYAIY